MRMTRLVSPFGPRGRAGFSLPATILSLVACSMPDGLNGGRRQVLQPRDLVAQKLIVDLGPGVCDPELVVRVTKPLVFSFELFNPDVGPISPLQQASHELSQRLQRQRIGMLGLGQAALRHAGSES
jgi:hypothetical protein